MIRESTESNIYPCLWGSEYISPTSILPDVPTASQNQPSSKPWCGYSMDRTSERRDARWSRWFQGWNAKTVKSGTSNPNNTHNLPKLLMDVVLSISPSWSQLVRIMNHSQINGCWIINDPWKSIDYIVTGCKMVETAWYGNIIAFFNQKTIFTLDLKKSRTDQ